MPVNPACDPALVGAPGLIALFYLDDLTAAPGDPVNEWFSGYDGVVTDNGLAAITPLEPALACDEGSSFHFDQDFVTVAGGIPELDAATEFTFFAWVRRDDGPGTAGLDFGIMDRRSVFGGANGGAALFINQDDELSLSIYDGTSPSPEVCESTVPVPNGVKTFCAGTWKLATNTAKVYVDGQPAGSLVTTQTPPTASRPFLIGFDTVQPSSALGHIDNVGVCTQALSDAEILALYTACRCARQRSTAQLVS